MDSLREAMHAEASGVPSLGDIDRAIYQVSLSRRRWAGAIGAAAVLLGLLVALLSPGWQQRAIEPAVPQPTPTTAPARGVTPVSTLVASIPLEGRDHGIAVDPSTGTVLVATAGHNAVSVIDTVTQRVIGTVRRGEPPGGASPSPGYDAWWTGQSNPWAIAVDPAAGEAYVTYPNANRVAVVDTATWEVVGAVDVGKSPLPVAVDPVAAALYVGNRADGTVSVIDTRTRLLVDTIPVVDTVTTETTDTSPWGLAVDPTSGDVYVANGQAGTLSVIDRDSRTVVETIKGLDNPKAVAVDLSIGEAYVSGGETVSVIDTNTHKVIDTIAIKGGVSGVAVDPTAGVAYVNADGLTVIDTITHTVIDTIDGSGGFFVAVDPRTGRVYVTQGDQGQIAVFGAP